MRNNKNKSEEKIKAVGLVASRRRGPQEGIKSKIQSKDQEPRTYMCCF